MPTPRTDTPGRIIAHRGASRMAPENTLAAFRAAADQGARWVEFDVSLLGDGTAVIHHDHRWGRCTNGRGRLTDAARADLDTLDAGGWFAEDFAGERVPLLGEALDLLDRLGLSANLEMKAHGDESIALAETVTRALISRPWTRSGIVVSSFEHATLRSLRGLMPDQPIALLWDNPPEGWQDEVEALDAAALHLNWRNLSTALLDDADAAQVDVRVYTINCPDRVAPYRDGLTGVITDHPPLFLDQPDWAAWATT